MKRDYTDPAAQKKYLALLDAGYNQIDAELEAFAELKLPATKTPADAAPAPRKSIASYKPFPTDLLPPVVSTFVSEVAAATYCDESFAVMPLLAVLGSSIGTTRRAEIKRSWKEYPILWPCTIGDSGMKKSPPFDAALSPLHSLQADAYREWEAQNEEHKAQILEYERSAATYKKHGGEVPLEPNPPKLMQILTQDSTVEGIGGMLAETPRGLLLGRDELSGWVASFNQYKGGKGGDVPAWLEFYRGGAVKIDRRCKPSLYIPRAAVWVTGTIQPGTFRRCMTPELFESGFVPRLLLAYPPSRASKWSDKTVSESAEQAIGLLIQQLRALTFKTTESGEQFPVDIPFTDTAQKIFAAFVNEHGEEVQALGDDRLRAVYSKLEGSAARFALIDRLCRTAGDPFVDVDVIDVENISIGIELARWFAGEAGRIYSMMGEADEEKNNRELIEFVSGFGGEITISKMQQYNRKYRGKPKAAESALQALVDCDIGQWEYVSTGGRQAHIFKLNSHCLVNKSANGDSANKTFVDARDVSNEDLDKWGKTL